MKILTQNFDLGFICQHKGHLALMITGNQTIAEFLFNQCYASSIFLKADIYPVSIFDPKEKVEFLLNETNMTDENIPLNLSVDMYIKSENNESLYLGTYTIRETRPAR